MCVCVYVCLCDFNLKDFNEHVPAREITNNAVKKKYQEIKKKIFKKLCYNMGENCQQVLLIGACCIQCWCVVVLVHKCLFNHPFSPLGGGVYGLKGCGLFTTERRGKE